MIKPQNSSPVPDSSACCRPCGDRLYSLEEITPEPSSVSHRTPGIIGLMQTGVGSVPVVATKLRIADWAASWGARWGISRSGHPIAPGLYAIGHPAATSPVFVSANYRLSFDRLRSDLDGIDGWILVLDTKGINVWCAAGKGTFGTDELVNRIKVTNLERVVSHRRVIVPQLGAPGISAHAVRERCDYRVIYGPVRSRDIKAFLQSGMKATPSMRRVTFTFAERIVLVPIEALHSLKYAALASALFLLLSGLGSDFYSVVRVAEYGAVSAAMPLYAALAGAVLPAILLPWLPGRAFSLKGAWAGLLPMIGVVLVAVEVPELFQSPMSLLGWLLLIPAVTSFGGMNFTGSSTYTSLSGVRREMRNALPAQIACAAVGFGLWLIGLFV